MTEMSAAELAFNAALRLTDPGERKAYLDRAGGENAALRVDFERLLTAHA